MTPGNRHDEIQDALREISGDAMARIGENLAMMDKRITLNLASVKSDLPRIRATICEENAKTWYESYLATDTTHVNYSWQESYAALLEQSRSQPDNNEIAAAVIIMEKKRNIVRWKIPSLEYEHHLRSCRVKNLEELRFKMIAAEQDYNCHLGILRNHEGHNYSQRSAMSQSVQKAAGVLHKRVEEWNQIRLKLGNNSLQLQNIREQGILSWIYDGNSNVENKHNYWYYELISLRKRCEEERSYVNKEIQALMDYGVSRVRLQAKRYEEGDLFLGQMLHDSRAELSKWYGQLLHVIVREKLVINDQVLQFIL
jgi:hypothetical protein